jgi:hypothetical protein
MTILPFLDKFAPPNFNISLADDILSSFGLAYQAQLWGHYVSVSGTSQFLRKAE